jgi:CheY-like chemotaxis protein
MQVLVVDDCSSVRLVVSKHLRKWGFEPICASDAFEVLEMIEAGKLPRLIFADWVMPKMEGPELIREIRNQDPERSRYIIMLTGKTGREVLETAFRCGADDYMSKPIIEEELQRRVFEGKNILDRHDAVMAS